MPTSPKPNQSSIDLAINLSRDKLNGSITSLDGSINKLGILALGSIVIVVLAPTLSATFLALIAFIIIALQICKVRYAAGLYLKDSLDSVSKNPKFFTDVLTSLTNAAQENKATMALLNTYYRTCLILLGTSLFVSCMQWLRLYLSK